MDEYIVVDGYNVVYAWPELAELADVNLGHARDKLANMLINYAGFSGDRVVLVFDAHKVRGEKGRRLEANGVQIYYTKKRETADSLIERLVGDLPQNSNVRVVTSDWEEQRVIFGRGAYRMTPKELLAKVREVSRESQSDFSATNCTGSYLEDRLGVHLRQRMELLRRGEE